MDTLIAYTQANYIEFISAILQLLCVYLTTRQNIWAWPTGLAGIAFAMVVYWDSGLPLDFVLYGIFAVLNVYGWYEWLYGGKATNSLKVTQLVKKKLIALLGLAAIGTVSLGAALYKEYEPYHALSFADAFTTSFSIVAQYLLAKKKIENWLIWIVVNVVAIGLYLVKELYFFAGLYTAFLGLATMGYLEWRKDMRQERLKVQ